MFQARQGDIFFEEIKELPQNLKKYDSNILAYGEMTGHSHQIITPSMSELDSYVDEDGDIFVRSTQSEIKIGHDEHDIVTLPKNQWHRISRQREYDPVLERQRQVAD